MGQAEIGALTSLLSGNVSLAIGLVLCLFGLYQILVARNSGLGFTMIAVGLLLPFTPNLMSAFQDALCPIVNTLGGKCGVIFAPGGGGNSNILMQTQGMEARPVPRNIDAPNRMPEYTISFVASFYTTMFIFHMPSISLICAVGSVYLIYKYTLDKPEGLMFRAIYRHMQIGKFRPSPVRVKRFEIN